MSSRDPYAALDDATDPAIFGGRFTAGDIEEIRQALGIRAQQTPPPIFVRAPTKLPKAAIDGQLVYYQPDASLPILWTLRYDATQPTYRWVGCGGEWGDRVEANVVAASGWNSYNPSLVAAHDGYYDLEASAGVLDTAATPNLDISPFAAHAGTPTPAVVGQYAAAYVPTANVETSAAMIRPNVFVYSGDTIAFWFSSGTATGNIRGRALIVRPGRLAGV